MKRDKNRGPRCLRSGLHLKSSAARGRRAPWSAGSSLQTTSDVAPLWAWVLLHAALDLSNWTMSPHGQCCWLSVQEEHWKYRVGLVAMGIASMSSHHGLLPHPTVPQLGGSISKVAVPAPQMVATTANGWSHQGCGDVVPPYLGEVLQSTECCLQCRQAVLQKMPWRNRNKRHKIPNSWLVMSQQRVANISDSLYVFIKISRQSVNFYSLEWVLFMQ